MCEKRQAHLAAGSKGDPPCRVRGPGRVEELVDMVTLKPKLERGSGVSLIKETRFLEETSSKAEYGYIQDASKSPGWLRNNDEDRVVKKITQGHVREGHEARAGAWLVCRVKEVPLQSSDGGVHLFECPLPFFPFETCMALLHTSGWRELAISLYRCKHWNYLYYHTWLCFMSPIILTTLMRSSYAEISVVEGQLLSQL